MSEQQKLGNTVSELTELLPDFSIVQKTEFNCFLNPSFAERIRGLNRSYLVIAGVEAHICIMQTVVGGLPEYKFHVVSDAIASRVVLNKDIALQRMKSAGATITSTEMFIYEVMKKAGTDEFKSVLPLIK